MKAVHESLLDSLDAAERARKELEDRLKVVMVQANRDQRQLKCALGTTNPACPFTCLRHVQRCVCGFPWQKLLAFWPSVCPRNHYGTKRPVHAA